MIYCVNQDGEAGTLGHMPHYALEPRGPELQPEVCYADFSIADSPVKMCHFKHECGYQVCGTLPVTFRWCAIGCAYAIEHSYTACSSTLILLANMYYHQREISGLH